MHSVIKEVPVRFESDIFKVSADEVFALKKRYCDSCNICGGTRIIETETQTYKCECLQKFNDAYALAHANVPVAFRELTSRDLVETFKQENFDNFKRVRLYSRQLQKALDAGFGLFIEGENGTGKSFIATLILKHAIKNGYSGYFILMSDLVNAAFEALRDPDVKRDLEKLITKIDFLVIDEVDKGFQDQSDTVQKILLPLFKKRCDYYKKPLIVTSNVDKSSIDQTIGKTISATFTERLTEITFTGNYRPQILDRLEQEFFND